MFWIEASKTAKDVQATTQYFPNPVMGSILSTHPALCSGVTIQCNVNLKAFFLLRRNFVAAKL